MISRGIGKSAARSIARSMSQFGSGGGVAPSFTPADLTGLQLWLDASDSSTVLNSISPNTPATDGQTVRRWLDKSGNDLHAEQYTAANQPLLDADGQNSKGVLTFDGVNDYLLSGTTSSFNFLHDGTESLVVIVAKAGATANPDATYSFLSTGTGTADVGYALIYRDRSINSENNSLSNSVGRNVQGAYAVDSRTNDVLLPNQYNIIENVIDADNATAANRSLSIVNGGAEFGDNALTNAPVASDADVAMHIGVTWASTTPGNFSSWLLGGIAELIICNDPNTALRSNLRTYLANKWGITLS